MLHVQRLIAGKVACAAGGADKQTAAVVDRSQRSHDLLIPQSDASHSRAARTPHGTAPSSGADAREGNFQGFGAGAKGYHKHGLLPSLHVGSLLGSQAFDDSTGLEFPFDQAFGVFFTA